MKARIAAAAAVIGCLLFVPIAADQAKAGHGGGFGGMHVGGGMGGPHFAGGGMSHLGGMGGPRFASPHFSGMAAPHFAYPGGRVASARIAHPNWNGNRFAWNGREAWRGNEWHGHGHNHFVHDHHSHNRFVRVGIGWWPGYYYGYDYGYGYDGCGWLRRQALITGSPYWWNRYYACINYY